MSKAIEGMVKVILNAMGVDADAVEKVVTERVKQFEGNIDMLNTTLSTILATQKRIELNQVNIAAILAEHLSVVIKLQDIPTANGEAHDNNSRDALLASV